MKNILKNINLIDGLDNLYSLGGFDIYAQPAHRTEIVFIESNVPDYQQLISGLSADKEYFVLDAQIDGLAQMAKILAERSDVDAIHIVSHGASGQVNLGSLLLDAKNIDLHSGDLATIGAALKADGDILLYGCSVGATEAGKALLGDLAIATGADIAASSNLTGSTRWGGDWDLEVKTGSIEAAPVVSEELAILYQHLLIESATVIFDDESDDNFISRGNHFSADDNVIYKVNGNSDYSLIIDGVSHGVLSWYGYVDVGNSQSSVIFSFASGAEFTPNSLAVANGGSLDTHNLIFKGYNSNNLLIATKSIITTREYNYTQDVIDLSVMVNITKLVLTTTSHEGIMQNVRLDNFVFDSITPPVLGPTITSVTPPTDKTYKIGDHIDVVLNTSADITVGGIPYIPITLDTGGVVNAAYLSGSGTSDLTFRYTVVSGDLDADGISVGSAISLNSGTMKDTSTSDDLVLTVPASTTTGVRVDGVLPTATITVADTALGIGETSLVTITFSEKVTGFTNDDLTIANGTLSAVSSSDGGIVWTATFTPAADITDTTNLITLDNTGVTDTAGNAGAGTTDSNNYAVDTQRPTASIVVADTALAIGETSLVTITFSKVVMGLTNADLNVANGTLSSISSSDGGTVWTATFTPAADITDTTNLITLDNTGVTDTAGNAGAGTTDSNNYAVDTQRPTASIVVADTALAIGETSLVTITFSEKVTGFTNDDLTIANGTLSAVSSSDGGIVWTATFTPAADITDTTNLITLDNTGVTDTAGNAGAGTTDSNNYAVDTQAPSAPSTPDLADASDSGSSSSDNLTNIATPTFTGSAETGSSVTLYDGATVLGTATAADGTWSIESSSLSAGVHTITAQATDAAGNVGVVSGGLSVTIDTSAPTAATPVRADVSAPSGPASLTFTVDYTDTGGAGIDISTFGTGNVSISGGAGSFTVTDAQASGNTVTYTATHSDNWVAGDFGTYTIALVANSVKDLAGNAVAANVAAKTFEVLDNVAPTLGGTFTTAGSVNDNATTTPFSGVTYTDPDGTSYSATITYTAANGSLSGTGLTGAPGSYTVTGADAAALQANLQALVFTPTANQVAPSSTVATTFTLTPNDGSNGTANATTVVTATSINDAPTDIALSASSVAENTSTLSALTVGTLSTTDTDTGDAFTYSIVSGADQSAFQISGGNLQLKANTVLDYETKSSYDVTVRSTDAGGLTFDKAFTVALSDENDAPTVANATVNQAASATKAFSYTVASNTFADVDAGQTLSYSATQSDGSALPTWLTFTPATQTFSGTPAAGDTGTVSIKVTATDNGTGSLSVASTFDLVVSTGPTITSVTPPTDKTYKIGDHIDVVLNTSTAITVDTTDGIPSVAITLDTGGVVNADYLSGTGTSALTFRYTVVNGNLDANGISVGSAIDLNNGTMQDAGGEDLALTFTSPTTNGVLVDGVAPAAPSTPDLADASDSGSSSSDNLTNATTPTFTGTAEAGSTVKLYDGATVLGTVATAADGTWSIESSSLSAGVHTITAKATDAAGNVGEASGGLSVTIDTTAPTLTSANPADDTNGASVSNNLILTFSEALATNSGVIELHKSIGGALVESFTLSSSNVAGAVVTLNPSADLDYSTGYYLTTSAALRDLPGIGNLPVPSTGIQDLAGNAFAGITDATTLNFTTQSAAAPPEDPPTTPPVTPPTDDEDGVDAAVEDSVPGLPPPGGGPVIAGDGNGDGIKDSEQAAVASLTFLKTDTSVSNPGNAPKVFVTLVADAKDGQVNAGSKAVITSIAQKDAPANLPTGAVLPLGLFDFTAKAAAPGSTESFSIFIDGDIAVNGYWKEVQTGATKGTWVNLADPAYGGKIVTVQGKTRLDFSIQDGGMFDDDGKADGVITDPGGPGFITPVSTTCPFDPFRIDADKDGMTDAVELLRGSSSALKNNDVFSKNDLFVEQLYRDMFGREGYNDAGSAHWLNAMTTGVMTRTEVLTTVLNSPEFDTHAAAVIRLYHAALGRSPELCGYNYWLGQANAGMNTSEMGQAFLESSEFATKQAGLDNAGFVDLIYLNVLQRAPEAVGRAYWIEQLQTGKTDRGGMLYSVVQSQEFKAAMVDDVAVDILYLGLLDRTADTAETAYWMSQYSKYADPTALLQAASASTTEYHDRFLPSDGSTNPASLVGVLDEYSLG